MEEFHLIELVYSKSRIRCWIRSRKNYLLLGSLVDTRDLDLIWKQQKNNWSKGKYILTCISVKSDRMERRERSLTSVDVMGTSWTGLPTRPTHFQCNLFEMFQIYCFICEWLSDDLCQACERMPCFCWNMPFLVTSISQQHVGKTSGEKNPSLKFLFYFCFIHLATSNWKIIITKKMLISRKTWWKVLGKQNYVHSCGCQLLCLESEELV